MRYSGNRLLALAVLGAALGTPTAGAQTAEIQAALSARRQPPARRAIDTGTNRAAIDEARRIAVRIDEIIAAGYANNRVSPALVADDSTFFRRAALDVAGKIPAVNDARKFLS